MKSYYFEVEVKWSQMGIEAETREEAIGKLQDTFDDEFGFRPNEKEITKCEIC